MERYIYQNGKRLRCGYTTGSCAAAAAKAAALYLLTGTETPTVTITLPNGETAEFSWTFPERTKEAVTAAVIKDSGDDPDVTDKLEVRATVSRADAGFFVDGGEGVGRVTRPGLDQAVGEAAINTVPREMIKAALAEAAAQCCYRRGLSAIISVPRGREIAERTFNPRLGVEGGLSILGTSGIVEPMSRAALLDTIRTELRVRAAEGKTDVIVTPGNYGEEFLRERLKLDLTDCVKCSNFIGDTIDLAVEYGYRRLLLVGHIGKLVKLGSGIMDTHSRNADGRLETLASCALLAGADGDQARAVLSCNTTEDAVERLRNEGLLIGTMDRLLGKIEDAVDRRAEGKLHFGVIIFSRQSALTEMTKRAKELLSDDTFCASK